MKSRRVFNALMKAEKRKRGKLKYGTTDYTDATDLQASSEPEWHCLPPHVRGRRSAAYVETFAFPLVLFAQNFVGGSPGGIGGDLKAQQNFDQLGAFLGSDSIVE